MKLLPPAPHRYSSNSSFHPSLYVGEESSKRNKQRIVELGGWRRVKGEEGEGKRRKGGRGDLKLRR
eukprot:756518-Hanusia_phi.AAC.1